MSTSQRLVERVTAARNQRFVGREPEAHLFRTAVTAPELPFYLLYVYGPGGVGKTSLIREFRRICDLSGVAVFCIDGRNVEPTPAGFTKAFAEAVGAPADGSLPDSLAAWDRRHVLFVDTYEALAPLDTWMRETFLPELPEDTLIVLADRQAPASGWRTDAGWQALVRVLPLRNLSSEESRKYLLQSEVPSSQHAAVLDFTHGHPLALSLVADVFAQRPFAAFAPENAPDVVRRLLEQLVQKVPSPAHRATLEACSLLRLTTEPALAAILRTPDAHELFDWLRDLSFVESGVFGVFPHDLAREALAADLRWRNPDWYAELRKRARAYYSGRLQQTRGRDQQSLLLDYVYLYRDNPVVRPFFEWNEEGTTFPDTLRDADVPRLMEMVSAHEGRESARLAEHWLSRQPENFLIFRDQEQRPLGFMSMIALHAADPADVLADPATAAAWEYLRSHAPLRPGEGAIYFRHWMARDCYQSVSSVQSLILVNAARRYLAEPSLAYTFLPCADPDFWEPAFSYIDLVQVPEAAFKVGGRKFATFGHDWRAVPPAAWLALLAERETAASPQSGSAPQASQPVVVLSQMDFDSAVRDALHSLASTDPFRSNPLLRSRMVVESAGVGAPSADRATALRSLILRAAEALRASPRQDKAYQALYHTYIHPAPTQEAAAEILDLPFSTYRRHLKAGIVRLTESLWLLEIGAER